MAHDESDQTLRECVATANLSAFRAALAAIPAEQRPAFATRLRQALAQSTVDEPTVRQRQVGVPLVDRMRTPATVLMRQIRLEKLRIIEDAVR